MAMPIAPYPIAETSEVPILRVGRGIVESVVVTRCLPLEADLSLLYILQVGRCQAML